MAVQIKLPARPHGAGLAALLTIFHHAGDELEIEIDFGGLKWIHPSGLVTLVSTVRRWTSEGRVVKFSRLKDCGILAYLQRMDVLNLCGIAAEESFERKPRRGRFMPVSTVSHEVDRLGESLASCLAPGGDDYDHPEASLWDLAYYVFTELAANARQHGRKEAFAAAQLHAEKGVVRIALADNGMGIKESFLRAGMPWAQDISDAEAIVKALQPKLSSKGSPTNEGVGLTLVSELIRLAKGSLSIVSGKGRVVCQSGADPAAELTQNGVSFKGTLVLIAFPCAGLPAFHILLHEAKVKAGLLREIGAAGMFES